MEILLKEEEGTAWGWWREELGGLLLTEVAWETPGYQA